MSLSQREKQIAWNAFHKDKSLWNGVIAAVEAVLDGREKRESIDKQFEGISEFQQPSEQPPAGVVERMIDAAGLQSSSHYWQKYMGAAYQVARAEVIAEALTDPTPDEYKAIHESKWCLFGEGERCRAASEAMRLLITKRRARLAPEPGKVERVQAVIAKKLNSKNPYTENVQKELAAEIVAELEKQ